MPIQFDDDLTRLRGQLLAMGATAERMIRDATAGSTESDAERLQTLAANEDKMDRYQRDVDEETIRLICVYTPVAADLRELLMICRINAELERIGDQTMNISYYAETLLREPPLKPLVDLSRMSDIASKIVRKALDAFTQASADLARQVIAQDEQVDDLNDQIFRELMTRVLADPKTMPHAMALILVARAFERIADHAVNIAEDVVYIIEGRDIRHMHERPETGR
ncbi:MAG: phosphate signaling complex protein PhoU [Verrucomicrobiota bacterium]|nr:phosphate signaling complex protein PhoU [Verrucomicrobiota bacterium]